MFLKKAEKNSGGLDFISVITVITSRIMEFRFTCKFTHTKTSLRILIVRVSKTNVCNEDKQIQKKAII